MAHDDAPIKDEELDEDAPRRPSPQAGPRRHPDEAHRLRDIPRTELEEHFYMSIENAAAKMNIGLTTLKKLCRQYGIGRWPFRKAGLSQSRDYVFLIELLAELNLPADSALWDHIDASAAEHIRNIIRHGLRPPALPPPSIPAPRPSITPPRVSQQAQQGRQQSAPQTLEELMHMLGAVQPPAQPLAPPFEPQHPVPATPAHHGELRTAEPLFARGGAATSRHPLEQVVYRIGPQQPLGGWPPAATGAQLSQADPQHRQLMELLQQSAAAGRPAPPPPAPPPRRDLDQQTITSLFLQHGVPAVPDLPGRVGVPPTPAQHTLRPGGYSTPPPPLQRPGGSLPANFFGRPEPSLIPPLQSQESHSDLYDVLQSLVRLHEGQPGRAPTHTPPLPHTTYRTMSYPPDQAPPLPLPLTRAMEPLTQERILGELQTLLQRDPQAFLSALQGMASGGPTPQRGEERPRSKSVEEEQGAGQQGSSRGTPAPSAPL